VRWGNQKTVLFWYHSPGPQTPRRPVAAYAYVCWSPINFDAPARCVRYQRMPDW